MTRLSPREAEEGALNYVGMHPGCSKAAVTSIAGWPISALERLIGRGVIRAERPDKKGPYRLYPADGEDG